MQVSGQSSSEAVKLEIWYITSFFSFFDNISDISFDWIWMQAAELSGVGYIQAREDLQKQNGGMNCVQHP